MDQLVLTVEQAAEVCQVSERTIRRAIWNEHLEAHTLGETHGLRIKPAALEAWLEIRSTLRERKPLPVVATPIHPAGAGRPRASRARGRLDFGEHRKAS